MKKVAYLILAHTDPVQLSRLVCALNHQSRVFVHLDRKSDISTFRHDKIPAYTEFIHDRVSISWGGFRMIQATLNLIEAALASQEDFSHLVLLSGLDYPIKPSKQIHAFLNEHSEKQFIRYYRLSDIPEQSRFRFERYRFMDSFLPPGLCGLDRSIRKIFELSLKPIRRKFISGLIPAFGSQWWALTPNCCHYILDFLAQNKEFRRYYKTTYAPDEFLFQTIVANSAYANSFEPYKGKELLENRYVINPLCHISNLHVINPHLSRVCTLEDWSVIQQSNKMFVRKITTEKSIHLINKIDRELLRNLEKSEDG